MLPTPFPWYLLPQIELARFKAIDFFPPKPERMEALKSICLGSKSRTIGDALVLSSLPRRLKERYPGLKVLIYPRGFNPVVFWNNPYVDGLRFLPDALYGDDANEGSGQLIQLKERFFGLEPSEKPRPEIYLTESESRRAREFLGSMRKLPRELPLMILHPFGQTSGQTLAPGIWASFAREQRERFRIVQVGVEGQPKIPGCDLHFLAPKTRARARRLFALIREADRFVGVDSGPMHVARAFGIPSLILTGGAPPEEVFEKRSRGPYFLHGNRIGAFLYEDARHLHVPSPNASPNVLVDASGILHMMGDFASQV